MYTMKSAHNIEECAQQMESVKQNFASVSAENEQLHAELREKNVYVETIQQNIASLSSQNEQLRFELQESSVLFEMQHTDQLALESSYQQLSVQLQEVTLLLLRKVKEHVEELIAELENLKKENSYLKYRLSQPLKSGKENIGTNSVLQSQVTELQLQLK